MAAIRTLEGDVRNGVGRYALVVARFNSFVVDGLLAGALDTFKSHGVRDEDITIVRVPGAWELPLAIKRVAATKRFDAIVALGAVIRGGTPHFEYVSGETARGIAGVGLAADLPVIFGVLTVDNVEQAMERSGTGAGNKGIEAALAALDMVSLLRQIG